MKSSRPWSRLLRAALIGAGVAVLLAVACGGGDDTPPGDGSISDAEAAETTNAYFARALGLFTGDTDAQDFIDMFAPECREDVDTSGLAFVTLFMQALAPDLKDLEIEAVDVGELSLEHTAEGTLVSPADPQALRVKVDGNFVPASQVFADAGFEPTEDTDLAEPVLLVRREGKIYLGDCSELEGLSGGMQGADPTPATGPGSSRTQPIPFGDTAVVEETWRLRVVEVDRDGWPEVQAENQFNEPPAQGERLLLVRVAAENVSKDDAAANIGTFEFAMVGSRNELYDGFNEKNYCGLVPDELDADLFPGGSTEGNVCFKVPEDETGFVLVWDSFLEGQTFFALE